MTTEEALRAFDPDPMSHRPEIKLYADGVLAPSHGVRPAGAGRPFRGCPSEDEVKGWAIGHPIEACAEVLFGYHDNVGLNPRQGYGRCRRYGKEVLMDPLARGFFVGFGWRKEGMREPGCSSHLSGWGGEWVDGEPPSFTHHRTVLVVRWRVKPGLREHESLVTQVRSRSYSDMAELDMAEELIEAASDVDLRRTCRKS